MPDPYQLKKGWLSEEAGIIYWLPMTYGSIFIFIIFHPIDLGSDDLNDYKNTKAYSYFANGWLGKISAVLFDSTIFLIKADCRLSERISDPDHNIWACLTKKVCTIKSAHCSCRAGMSETWNHVAAMLIHTEVAVLCGLTKP